MTETKKAMCFEASFFSLNHKKHPSFDARNKIRIFSAEWIPTITLTKECPEELLHLKPISRTDWNSEDFLDDVGRRLIECGYDTFFRQTSDFSATLEYLGPEDLLVKLPEVYPKAARTMKVLEMVSNRIASHVGKSNKPLSNMGHVLTALISEMIPVRSKRWSQPGGLITTNLIVTKDIMDDLSMRSSRYEMQGGVSCD